MKEMEAFLQTLPISFYTKEDKKYSLVVNQGKEAYINFLTDTITIGLSIFKDICEDVKELHIRSLFYHEVSHAILTDMEQIHVRNFTKKKIRAFNPNLQDFSLTENELHQVLNICEDERIETILRDYYYNVDFIRFVNVLNHKDIPDEIKKPLHRFFDAIRLHKGPFAEEAKAAMKSVLKANAKTADYLPLVDLYLRMKENEEGEDQDEGQSNGKGGEGTTVNPNRAPDKELGEDEGVSQGQKASQENSDKEDEAPSLSKKEADEIVKESINKKRQGQAKAKEVELLKEATNNDFKLEHLIKKIALKAKAKDLYKRPKAGRGYVAREVDIYAFDDLATNRYKIFKSNRGDKGSNKVAIINFFIDSSGSFYSNEVKVNRMLAELEGLEKKIKDFKFTLTTIGYNQELTLTDKAIRCSGGTSISKRLEGIYKELNVPNSHNIFLLDGRTDVEGNTLQYLDTHNMYICADGSNEDWFKDFRQAKVELVKEGGPWGDSNVYSEKLERFITSTLYSILRTL